MSLALQLASCDPSLYNAADTTARLTFAVTGTVVAHRHSDCAICVTSAAKEKLLIPVNVVILVFCVPNMLSTIHESRRALAMWYNY